MTAKEYLKDHAISAKSVKDFGITYDDNYLTIPIYDENGEFVFNKVRNLNFTKDGDAPKYKNESGSHATLYNYHNVKDKDTIVICEGEMDCICLNQNGIPAVTPTSGAGKFDETWVPLLTGKKIYICLDNDEAGKKGTRKLLELFPLAKVIEITEGKDVCDFFSKYTRDDFVSITRIATTKQEWDLANKPEEHTLMTAYDLCETVYEEDPWLIEGILAAQGFCFLYGAEGTGKSLIATSIAKALATGQDWLDKFKTTGTYNVLILDKENPHPLMQKRLKGMGANNKNIYLLKYPEKFALSDGNGNASKFATDVADAVREYKIDCIIIDSFVDFVVGNESSSTDTQDFFNSIRELYPRIAYMGLHHENKPSQGVFRNDSQRMRGSSNINAQLFTAFRLEPVAKSKVELTLKQVKARDRQKLDKFMIRMQVLPVIGGRDGDTYVAGFEYCGLVEESVDESKMGELESIISEMLTSNAYVSRKQIEDFGEGKGVSVSTIRRTLKKMLDEGSINEFKKGKEKWYTRGLLAKADEDDSDLDPSEIFDGSVEGLDD